MQTLTFNTLGRGRGGGMGPLFPSLGSAPGVYARKVARKKARKYARKVARN